MDLFDAGRQALDERQQPLAARLRPRTLDEFVGQDHILGPGRLLRRAIQADQLSSLIFYGPPGTGKTTLAAVIANTTRSHFLTINAVLAGVGDIRQAIDTAGERRKLHNQRSILFIDEVHRFNKAQQDALLPWVENGTVVLVGATTENPYFSVNRPLLSRSRIFQLKPLAPEDLRRIARQALVDPRGYAARPVELQEEALRHLTEVANGDARSLLNALELAVETTAPDSEGVIQLDLEVAEESIQRRAVLYDKEGDYHFDTISAFIKSLRGSDPDAAMYWLARMVYAGEDPRFLFRRMSIFASEDVGMADPQAIQIVTAAATAYEHLGLPEGRFSLAHAALYLATAPKSNSIFAFFDALAAVEQDQQDEVPNHLKDASRDSEGFGHGANYLYPHAYRDHWVAQQYLPTALQGRVFYRPGDQGYERQIRDQVRRRRETQLAAMVEGDRAIPEVLTYSPKDQAREQWLQRATSEFSGYLAAIRQRVFAALGLQRHHLILDLNAGTGLLTWEAMRQVPEGGVWSQVADRTSAITLQEMAAQLPEIERPTIVQGDLCDLLEQVENREPGLRFDAIVGRNALGNHPEKRKIAHLLRNLLAPDGQLSLAETFSRQAQRLYRLVDLNKLDQDLQERMIQAEEAIYADPRNPQLNWEATDLETAFSAAGFSGLRWQLETSQLNRLITPQQVSHWFSAGGRQRPTYASYLRRQLDEKAMHQVRLLFEKQLTNRTISWSYTELFLSAASRTSLPTVDLTPVSS